MPASSRPAPLSGMGRVASALCATDEQLPGDSKCQFHLDVEVSTDTDERRPIALRANPWSNCGNFSLASNLLMSKNNSTVSSWGVLQGDVNRTLPEGEPATAERQPLFATWVTSRNGDSSNPGGDRATLFLSPVYGGDCAPPRGCLPFSSAKSSEIAGSSGEATVDTDRTGKWKPQGLIGGNYRRYEALRPDPATTSMASLILENEVPEDLPPPPSPCHRGSRRLSPPSVNPIELNIDYNTPTPFMSISSPFSECSRSLSRHKNSVQCPTGASQHCHTSTSSLLMTHGVPSLTQGNGGVAVGDTKTTGGASPFHGSAAGFSGAGHSPELPELTELVEDRAPADQVTTPELSVNTMPSTRSAGNSSMQVQQVSPQNPKAPTVPSTPLVMCNGGAPSARLMKDMERERAAVVREESGTFKKLRLREASAVTAFQRKLYAETSRPREYPSVALRRKLVEEEAKCFNESMLARQRAAESEHQQTMRRYACADEDLSQPLALQLPCSQRTSSAMLHGGSERAAIVGFAIEKGLADTATMVDDTGFCSIAPHTVGNPPHEGGLPVARRYGGKEIDPSVHAEIQRQLRLGRYQFPNADAWAADSVFSELQ